MEPSKQKNILSKEKRGDREVENLFSILEIFTDIKDTQVDRIKRSAEAGLPVLNEKLAQLQLLCVNSDKEYLEFQEVRKEEV